jgi:hypothetical protein
MVYEKQYDINYGNNEAVIFNNVLERHFSVLLEREDVLINKTRYIRHNVSMLKSGC